MNTKMSFNDVINLGGYMYYKRGVFCLLWGRPLQIHSDVP